MERDGQWCMAATPDALGVTAGSVAHAYAGVGLGVQELLLLNESTGSEQYAKQLAERLIEQARQEGQQQHGNTMQPADQLAVAQRRDSRAVTQWDALMPHHSS